MKNKKAIIATIVVVVFVQIYEFLVHGVLLKDMYNSSASVWRPEAVMESYIPWMMFGQVLFAVIFCLIYCCSKCTASIKQGATFGFYVGLLMASSSFVFYAVLPIPLALMLGWVVSSIIEGILIGVILASILKKAE